MPRIFLSYARSDDESFVERLRDDLAGRGFDVWWDRTAMGSRGLPFRQEILDAVGRAERLVLVVGPGAIASPNVRQEWRHAIETDRVVTPILRRGDHSLLPDEFRLLHAEDFRDDARYERALENLARQLSEPVPSRGKLIAVPSLPTHYLKRPERLAALSEALRADLERPVTLAGSSARVGIHGMGGVGKSVLAAAVARDPAIRLAFPDGVCWIALGPSPTLDRAMRELLRELGGEGTFATIGEGRVALAAALRDRRALLVLDDAWRRTDVEAFDVLGPRCRALITTRDSGLLTSLGGTHHRVELLSEQDATRLLAANAGLAEDVVLPGAAQLVVECGRLPLALALCGGMLRRGTRAEELLAQLREARIERIADRHASEPQHVSLRQAIHISVEALAPETRGRFLELASFAPGAALPTAAVAALWSHTGGLDDWSTGETLRELTERSLLSRRSPTGEVGGPSYALHDLIDDYVRGERSDPVAAHETLLAAYAKLAPSGWASGPNDGYFLGHLAHHLIAAGRSDEFAALLLDPRWMEAKNAAGALFDLPREFAEARAAVDPDDDRARTLGLIELALRRHLHFAHRHRRDYPQGLFQALWNEAWWHDAPETARHAPLPRSNSDGEDLLIAGGCAAMAAIAAFGVVASVSGWRIGAAVGLGLMTLWAVLNAYGWFRRRRASAPRRGPLSTWLEEWRRDKERARPGFVWLRALRPPALMLESGLVASWRAHDGYTLDLALSPDGETLASVAEDRSVRLWSSATGEPILKVDLPGPGRSVDFSPDGRRLAAVCGTTIVLDALSGATTLEIDSGDPARFARFSPDGKRLAIAVRGFPRNVVEIRDASDGSLALELQGHQGEVHRLAFSPDGSRLATSSADKTVRIWDLTTGEATVRHEGHLGDVRAATFSPDGAYVASCAWGDRTVRVWESANGRLAAVADCTDDLMLESVAFSPDGERLVVGGGFGSDYGTIRVWKWRAEPKATVLSVMTAAPQAVRFDAEGRRVVSISQDGLIRIRTATARDVERTYGDVEVATSASLSPDGRTFCTRDEAGLGFRDARTGLMRRATGARVRGDRPMQFSLDGKRVVVESDSTDVIVVDVARGSPIAVLNHADAITAGPIALSSDGAHVATHAGGRLRVWREGVLVHSAPMPAYLTALAFSPDGALLAGLDGKGLRLWKAPFSDPPREIIAARGGTALAFSPDGARIAVADGSRRVIILDVASGARLVETAEAAAVASRLRFSSSGDRIAAAAFDGSVRAFDAATGRLVRAIDGSADPVAAAGPAERFPLIAVARSSETVVETSAGVPVAYWPEGFHEIAMCPDGRSFVGAGFLRTQLVVTEGELRRNSEAASPAENSGRGETVGIASR